MTGEYDDTRQFAPSNMWCLTRQHSHMATITELKLEKIEKKVINHIASGLILVIFTEPLMVDDSGIYC